MKKIAKLTNLLSNTINTITEFVVVLLLLVLSLFMVLSVFYRYVLNNSIYYSTELCEFLLVAVTFLGSTVAFKHKAHIGVDLFIEKLSPEMKNVMLILIDLSFLFFWGLIFVESLKLLPLFWLQKTATLQIPYAYVFLVLPISSVIWCIHSINDIVQVIAK